MLELTNHDHDQSKHDIKRSERREKRKYHEKRAPHDQQVLLIITAQEIQRRPIGAIKESIEKKLTENAELSPEAITDSLDSLIGYQSHPLTVDNFVHLDETIRRIVLEELLPGSPAIILPHTVEVRMGIVNYRLERADHKDRGVALVTHDDGRIVTLLEGRLVDMPRYGLVQRTDTLDAKRLKVNPIVSLNLEDQLRWFTIREAAEALVQEVTQYNVRLAEIQASNPDHKQAQITVSVEDMMWGLAGSLSLPIKPRKTPSFEEMRAREQLLDIINHGPETFPLATIARLATIGTIYQSEIEDYRTLDESPEVLATRKQALFTWAKLLTCLPDEVALQVYMNVVEIADGYSRIARASQQQVHTVREIEINKVVRELKARTNALLDDDDSAAAQLKSQTDAYQAQLEAHTQTKQAQIVAETERKLLSHRVQREVASAKQQAFTLATEDAMTMIDEYKNRLHIWLKKAIAYLLKNSSDDLARQIVAKGLVTNNRL